MGRRLATGIDAHNGKIRIRLWRKGTEFQCFVKGDPHSEADIRNAIAQRKYYEHRLGLGLPLSPEDDAAADNFFGIVAQEYLDQLDVELSTKKSYSGLINKYWMPVFHDKLMSEITLRQIHSVLNAADVSGKTKNNALHPLRGIFTYAMDKNYVHDNPAARVARKKHQKPPVERFKEAEREKILAVLEGQAHCYFALMFGTGMRPSELLALRKDDVRDGVIHVNKTIVRRRHKRTTKTHEARDVVYDRWLDPIIAQQKLSHDEVYLFVNTQGGPHLDTDQFNGPWRAALKKARVRYRIPYTCRHTRASELLVRHGLHYAKAAQQMGHRPETFFRTYAEWIDESEGRAVKDILRPADDTRKDKASD